MDVITRHCDKCKASNARRFSFPVDTEANGAGSSDTVHKDVDLCATCIGDQLEMFIEALPWPSRLTFWSKLTKEKIFFLSYMNRSQRIRGGVIEIKQP